jgi:preprotein translocase subunit SecE
MSPDFIQNVKSAPSGAFGSVKNKWSEFRTFLTEVRNELKRVTWPLRKEVYATTVVVILTSIIFGVYLWGIDVILSTLAERVFRYFGAA